jgi:uncharacterized protein (DUF934 family)
MPLVKNGSVVEDTFVPILDEARISDGMDVIVPAARLLADTCELANRNGRAGVIWPNDRPIGELVPHLDCLSLIALVFPNFRDGRAYSQARLLRERYHFRGEVRATGEILRDQFLFLQRAGFDAFDVKKPADALNFAKAVARLSVFYQPVGDGNLTVFRQRLARKGGPAPLKAQERVS